MMRTTALATLAAWLLLLCPVSTGQDETDQRVAARLAELESAIHVLVEELETLDAALRQETEEAEREGRATSQKQQENEGRLRQIEEQLNRLERDRDRLDDRLGQGESRLAEVASQLEESQGQRRALEKRVAEMEACMKSLLRSGGSPFFWSARPFRIWDEAGSNVIGKTPGFVLVEPGKFLVEIADEEGADLVEALEEVRSLAVRGRGVYLLRCDLTEAAMDSLAALEPGYLRLSGCTIAGRTPSNFDLVHLRTLVGSECSLSVDALQEHLVIDGHTLTWKGGEIRFGLSLLGNIPSRWQYPTLRCSYRGWHVGGVDQDREISIDTPLESSNKGGPFGGKTWAVVGYSGAEVIVTGLEITVEDENGARVTVFSAGDTELPYDNGDWLIEAPFLK